MEQSSLVGQTLRLRLMGHAGYRFNVEILDVESGFIKMRFLDGDKRTTWMPVNQIVEMEEPRDYDVEADDEGDPLLLASGH